jgi:hypothetical protein
MYDNYYYVSSVSRSGITPTDFSSNSVHNKRNVEFAKSNFKSVFVSVLNISTVPSNRLTPGGL